MENAEEILHYLEDFAKRKPKTIPQELNEYLAHVAGTGDPIYQWSIVKALFKEKLRNVITDFYETTPGVDIPPYPNVDPFNYDIMKNSLLERLDSFNAAPFTVQRICELLTFPRKQYNRIDKFMRAIEKNILVVSTREPGPQRHVEVENGEANDPIVNGSDNNSDYNVDVEMDDMSWKDKPRNPISEPQPGSSDAHISVDDIEARLQPKDDSMDTQDKSSEYISLTPPDDVVSFDKSTTNEVTDTNTKSLTEAQQETTDTNVDIQTNIERKTEDLVKTSIVIPEITIDDAEMTEQKLIKQASLEIEENTPENLIMSPDSDKEQKESEIEIAPEATNISEVRDDTHSPKLLDIMTSSEESSSSSDNTDGASNSPKPIHENLNDNTLSLQEEPSKSETLPLEDKKDEKEVVVQTEEEVLSDTGPLDPDTATCDPDTAPLDPPTESLQTDVYSISDVNSELPQQEPDIIEKKESNAVEPTLTEKEKVDEVENTKNIEQTEPEAKVVDEKGDS